MNSEFEEEVIELRVMNEYLKREIKEVRGDGSLNMHGIFSEEEKGHLADKIYDLLREINNPELPKGEIVFYLKVAGRRPWVKDGVVSKEGTRVFKKRLVGCDCGCGLSYEEDVD